MRAWIAALAFTLAAWMGLPAGAAHAQVGQCVLPGYGQSFAVYPNGLFVQQQNPANQAFGIRDLSGMTFMRAPSSTPYTHAYFIGWRGEVIEVNAVIQGWRVVGQCQFMPGFLPPPPPPVWHTPVWQPNYAIATPTGNIQVPQAFADPANPYAPPMLVSEGQAEVCYSRSMSATGAVDRQRFGDCMLREMLGQREEASLGCMRQSTDQASRAFCLVGVLGGENERRAAAQLQDCFNRYGDDYRRYPLCMGADQVGGDAGRLLACVEQQGGNVNLMGTAACYGAQTLNLNPEMQIVVGCAASTGGEPYAFAGCAGGQLTVREMDKCLQNGVGGSNGCFGPNNTIIQALNAGGQVLTQHFGPNNDLVRTWNNTMNDIQHGPGPNHEVNRTLSNVTNEVNRAATNVAREVGRAMPRIRISL